jgi:phosphoserine phosphatase
MRRYSVIWDFDGTILPSTPYDSEESLLMYKLTYPQERIGLAKRIFAKAIIYADRKERLRKTFQRFFVSFLKGTHTHTLDHIAERLAERISKADRDAILHLNGDGHDMMVISCGTADLSERVLKVTGLLECFSRIEGNRFQIVNNQLMGMDFQVPDPEDKVKLVNRLGVCPEKAVVVGDGYTDIPLLDWAKYPILLDRTGKKRVRFAKKRYHFVDSIPEAAEMIIRGFV